MLALLFVWHVLATLLVPYEVVNAANNTGVGANKAGTDIDKAHPRSSLRLNRKAKPIFVKGTSTPSRQLPLEAPGFQATPFMRRKLPLDNLAFFIRRVKTSSPKPALPAEMQSIKPE